jgi:predicted Zn-dependent peptidase
LLPIYGATAIFGEHGYARPVGGSEQSLDGLAHEDVVDYYGQHVGADRLILAITGDFDSAAIRRHVTEAFGAWGRARAPAPEVRAPARVTGRNVLLVDAPSSVQTYFTIGNVGVSKKYPERAALDVVNTLFGGRFTSMLNSELRIRTGLTYGARSQLARPSQPGAWQMSSFTRTDATEQAVDLALEVFAKLKSGAVDTAALESGKAYVIGQFPTQLETATQWAGQLAQLEFYGLDRSYIEGYGPALGAVTLDAAARVTADVYPASDDLAFVFIGDAAAIRDAVKKYGPVTEMRLSDPTFKPTKSFSQ